LAQLQEKFWSHLPKLKLPIDGDKWKPYWDAYEENPPQDWQLKMEMNNPRNDWFAKFCITVAEYETQLKKAFSDGSLTVHSALTHLPLLQSTSDSLRLAGFITVNALREFAAKSSIDIRVACNEGAVAQATAAAESKPQSEGTAQPENVSNSNAKPGLTRAQILASDWPLKGDFNKESFDRALSDVPEWLKPARITPGRTGSLGSATWNPSLIAVALIGKNYATKNALDVFFRSSLSDWLESMQRKPLTQFEYRHVIPA
jgi:hypothetical protein